MFHPNLQEIVTMKIGFAGRWSPLEKTSWSGTYFYTHQAIQKYFQTEIFYFNWPWRLREWLNIHKQIQKLRSKNCSVEFLYDYAKWHSRKLDEALIKNKVDILFVPAAPQLFAYSQTNIPVIFMTDATFKQIQGYYPSFNNLATYNIQQGIDLDQRSFRKAAHCMLASDWALHSTRIDYGISDVKSSVRPFGANLDEIPESIVAENRKPGKCRLLFLAVEWERKGGSLVLETFNILKKLNIPVQLTIIGTIPPGFSVGKQTSEDILVIPYLNKHNPNDSAELSRIFTNTDFLFLPSRAECAGIVFCEAAAYGIPSISTNTGGISTYVRNGINGFTLPIDAPAQDYASLIESIFCNEPLYENLCISSRLLFEQELNWDQWGNSFADIVNSL